LARRKKKGPHSLSGEEKKREGGHSSREKRNSDSSTALLLGEEGESTSYPVETSGVERKKRLDIGKAIVHIGPPSKRNHGLYKKRGVFSDFARREQQRRKRKRRGRATRGKAKYKALIKLTEKGEGRQRFQNTRKSKKNTAVLQKGD